MTRYFYDCRVRSDNVVEIRRQNGIEQLQISFKRTVRIPDNIDEFELPPDMGNFPLYKTEQYAQSLPESIVAKRGIFLPMYQREAMWINFKATAPFAVKVYAGSINAISGQPVPKSNASKLHQQSHPSQNTSKQDYIVVPGQKWLDGFATGNGVVRQFVATRLGDGYTVEAQVTGQEVYGGLQIEVTPAVVTIKKLHDPVPIMVKSLTGRCEWYEIDGQTMVTDLKNMIQLSQEIPADQQRLIFEGRQLEDDATVFYHTGGMKEVTLDMVLRLRGGGPGPVPEGHKEMGLAAGGLIKQTIVPDKHPAATWHKSATIVFNVQLLDAASFEAVTGRPAPETPVPMDTYAELGLPFFKLHEEPSGIHGAFQKVKSVGEIVGAKEKTAKVPVHHINKPPTTNAHARSTKHSTDTKLANGITNPAGPLVEFCHVTELVKELGDVKLAD
ncbi:hypothetical protein LTR10_024396 [Elasticomyces elasticus]|uniref:Ubiquitin-like domain-containing protein n=1 Tax=Exophiala sideris TaxID=1016849 RepID=A0ABR0JHZ7_9EURO|nr:hypothetical protein LTR10_024396 [Elasticomyces elasticus]KAK5034212.1 hypothetical protein LTS07_003132 [Exophiala sideris]KAK5042508.1 hypothetical protein LTR13_001355 [Exophiala sideris]KAK5065590.1 hypothetical protein LTR69_003139 [Exophiala sideris]KAK5185952.1 hypothetical protein LTR44_002001 [Eurotiomycetes sp. CCFEE 6388]